MKNFQIGPKDEKERRPYHEVLSKLIWLISTARNIIVVVVSGALAYVFELHQEQPFLLTGKCHLINFFFLICLHMNHTLQFSILS